MAENGSFMTGVFPGAPGATGRAASFTQKMAVLREFGSLHRELAARSPGIPDFIHRLSTKMAKLREFGSFCDNLPQI